MDEKTDMFRLADANVMPNRGQSSGYILLEAIARSIPIIDVTRGGEREASRRGLLGPLVESLDETGMVKTILEELNRRREHSNGLDFLASDPFTQRLQGLVNWSVAGCRQ